jgi:hypothetical protein
MSGRIIAGSNAMARWEEVSFTRVPEGWAFNASPTIFGAPHTYLVDDAQKAALVRRLRVMHWAAVPALLAVMALVLAPFIVYVLMFSDARAMRAVFAVSSPLFWIGFVLMFLVLVIGVLAVLIIANRIAVGPVVAGARELPIEVTLADRFKLQARAISPRLRLFIIACYAGATAMNVLTFTWNGSGLQLALAILFGLLGLHQIALLVLDLRTRRAATH